MKTKTPMELLADKRKLDDAEWQKWRKKQSEELLVIIDKQLQEEMAGFGPNRWRAVSKLLREAYDLGSNGIGGGQTE